MKSRIDFIREIERICDIGYELAVPSQVLDEIREISLDKSLSLKERKVAELTFGFIKMLIDVGKLREIDEKGKTADEAIMNLAEKEKIILATMDKELKKKAGKIARILTIRRRKKLEFIE